LISGSYDGKLPTLAAQVPSREELPTESLTPLQKEFLIFAELYRQIIRKVREVGTRSVRARFRRYRKLEGTCAGSLDTGIERRLAGANHDARTLRIPARDVAGFIEAHTPEYARLHTSFVEIHRCGGRGGVCRSGYIGSARSHDKANARHE
jgi:hypothetical protein